MTPAYLCLKQIRGVWTQKKPPEGLGSVVCLVLVLGKHDYGLINGAEISQGLRFKPLGDRPDLSTPIIPLMGGECFDPVQDIG